MKIEEDFYMKKLNNKGFTLIELLAVIVILAVVMGVAATSVLGAMNNSRKSQLQNSALSAADAFRTKYAEYSMGGQTSLLGYSGDTLFKAGGTNTNGGLLNGKPQNITAAVAKELNITSTNYTFANSWVYFETSTSTFIVCLTANPSGSYYYAGAIKTTAVAAASSPAKGALAANTMWACSDNTHSW